MQTSVEDPSSRSEQRAAVVRVFGGTALAFVILLILAAVVRPDLMQMAGRMAMALMPKP